MKFISQNENFPIIIEIEENVKFSGKSRKMIERIETKWNDKTIIIIAG